MVMFLFLATSIAGDNYGVDIIVVLVATSIAGDNDGVDIIVVQFILYVVHRATCKAGGLQATFRLMPKIATDVLRGHVAYSEIVAA